MVYTFKHGDRPLDGVTVQRAVGRGGFGEVYYALTDSGKQVALKYLRENPEIELRGIAQVMNLKSPHLITIYDVRTNPAGETFVLMEYVGGPSLRELLLAEPAGLGPQKAAFFLKGISRGLAYLHERGIVHRDLKPANIFYDDGYVKIGDYGLSKHISMSRHSGQTVSVGTVHYMAPEIGSGSYTQAIDIYALGVILFEMLTGRLPFSGSSMGEILMRHLRDQPDLTGVPAPFAPVIARALAKDPHDRYATVDEMLAAVMESEEISASVASFDASALSHAPRSPEARDPDRTITTPPRPPPPLDVRELPDSGALPERLQRRLQHLSRKLEHKAERLERRFGRRRHEPHAAGARPAAARPGRIGHAFILLAVTAGIAVALSLLHGGRHPEEQAIALGLYIGGAAAGMLLVHLRFLQRYLARNTLFDRFAYAGVAGLAMAPAALVADDAHLESLARLIVAPLAAILLCDWHARIEAGRAGRITGGAAVWPAIIGLVAAAIMDLNEYVLAAAAVCAAISLITQGAALMWPPQARPSAPPLDILGAHHGPLAAERLGPPVAPPGLPPAAAAGPDAETRPGSAPPAATAPGEPIVIEAARPSFVGRTAQAGVALLGKVLLLCGLLLAVGQGPLQDYVRSAASDIGSGRPLVDPDVDRLILHGVPVGFVILALAVGLGLLLLARRGQGAWHFVRGCLGGLLLFLGALVGMVGGRAGYRILFADADPTALAGRSPETWGPVLASAVLLACGALLMLWPSRSQGAQAIVI